MIRVNLMGRTHTRSAKSTRSPARAPRSRETSFRVLPILWAVVILGAAAWGYFWWSGLTNASARLDADIQTAEARRAELQAVIDQDAVYEELKAELERRIAAIDLLRRNRVSPVVSLDMLSEAVEDTRYVWISALNQTNTTFSINATGTSIQAIETFLINLDNTGYFTNVNLGPLQESGPNYTFQLAMTFVPPLLPGESAAAATSADARLAGAGGPEPGGGR